MDLKKDDVIRVKIEDMSDAGEGIGKLDGFTWFVKDAVPGDVAEARITGIKKTYGYAEVVRIVSPSPDRVTPRCPYFLRCGGCQLQALDYEAQLKFKEKLVKDRLKRIGGVEAADEVVRPVMGMEDPWRYRNNEQFFPGCSEDGRIVYGFYAGHTHEVTDIDDCPIGMEENRAILTGLTSYMNEHNIRPYDEKSGDGLVSRVQIRKGFATGEISVCLDIHGPAGAPEKRRDPAENGRGLAKCLCSLFPSGKDGPHIKSICCRTLSSGPGGKRGEKTVNIYGPGTITERIGKLTFQISPDSFYQVNPLQTESLYGTVSDFACLSGEETVWDLYCGTGTISLFLARGAKRVYGVESVPQAVKDARDNARRNGIGNVTFFAGKAEKILPEQFEKDQIRADVIVADPPRKGCARPCLDTMIGMRPSRIVYVSCDPATLARDAKILREGGYELKKAQPVDLFPQTVHTETVALFERC